MSADEVATLYNLGVRLLVKEGDEQQEARAMFTKALL
jgi:hypothetical protein